MNETVFKTVLAAVIAAVGAYFRVIAVPVLALLIFMIMDYATGMTAAYMVKPFQQDRLSRSD